MKNNILSSKAFNSKQSHKDSFSFEKTRNNSAIRKKITIDSNKTIIHSSQFLGKPLKQRLKEHLLEKNKAFYDNKKFSEMLKENKFKSYFKQANKLDKHRSIESSNYIKLKALIPAKLFGKLNFKLKSKKNEEIKKEQSNILTLDIQKYLTDEDFYSAKPKVSEYTNRKFFITDHQREVVKKDNFFDNSTKEKKSFLLNQIFNTEDEMQNFNSLRFFYLNRKPKIHVKLNNNNKLKIDSKIMENLNRSSSPKRRSLKPESPDISMRYDMIKTFKEEKSKKFKDKNFRTNSGLVKGFTSIRNRNTLSPGSDYHTRYSTTEDYQDNHYTIHSSKIKKIQTSRPKTGRLSTFTADCESISTNKNTIEQGSNTDHYMIMTTNGDHSISPFDNRKFNLTMKKDEWASMKKKSKHKGRFSANTMSRNIIKEEVFYNK